MKHPDRRTKIIIADDHPMMASALAQHLEDHPDYKVIQMAHSFDELMEALKKNPDILILDINLNGINAIKRMKQIKSLQPSLKVLIFSSYNMPSLVKKALKEGVNGYILKDTDRFGLLAALDAIENGKQYIGQQVAHKKKNISILDNSLKDDFIKQAELSKREVEIMKLIVEGKDNQVIAETLFISKHTVQSHRKSLFKKMNVHSAQELIRLVYGI
jgi:DNA-binding NarL/FixJ family response regulator